MSILTPQEAADILNYDTVADMPPKVISVCLPAVDEFIKTATGKEWGKLTDTYTVIDPAAKMVAGILLVRWFEDSIETGTVAGYGVIGLLSQLSAKYQKEKQAEKT